MGRINENDINKCLLCNDAKCSKACKKIDVAKAIRSLRFKNIEGAKSLVLNANCITCDAPCEDACIVDNLHIKELLIKLKNDETIKVQDVKNYNSLKTNFFGFEMDNPFILSSSVVGSNYDMCARAFEMGWAGVSFKTICLMDIHETSPRFSATKNSNGQVTGFKNVEQLSTKSLEENLEIFKKLKKNYPNKLLIASIMGRDEKEWEYLAKAVSKIPVDAIELNFSCPNMKDKNLGSDVGQVKELVYEYTKVVRESTKLPILAKLTPNVSSMKEIALAAKMGGADGISLINTIKSLINVNTLEDIKSGKPRPSAVGGYSGDAVKPISLRFLNELKGTVELKNLHYSAMGGIENYLDAIDYITLGADTLQVTTAVMLYGYRIIEDLCDGLSRKLKELNIKNVSEIKGSLNNSVVNLNELKRDIVIYPKFLRDKCLECGRCYISCMDGGHQAISIGKDWKPVLNPKKCVGCHLCVIVCPCDAIIPSKYEAEAK